MDPQGHAVGREARGDGGGIRAAAFGAASRDRFCGRGREVLGGVGRQEFEAWEAGRGQGGGGGGGGDDAEGEGDEAAGVASLSWCAGRFEPAAMVVGYSSGRVSVYRYDDGRRAWSEAMRLPGHAANGPRGVLDVAWAPNVGRSYHLIAPCGKDNVLKVHRIKRGRGNVKEQQGDGVGASSSLVYEGTEILDSTVQSWRCRWNVTGTVLASSGDGGVVRLWKCDFQGKWRCVSEILGDSTGGASSDLAAR